MQFWIQEQILSKFKGNWIQRLSLRSAKIAISPLLGLNFRFFIFHTL